MIYLYVTARFTIVYCSLLEVTMVTIHLSVTYCVLAAVLRHTVMDLRLYGFKNGFNAEKHLSMFFCTFIVQNVYL